MRPEKIRQDILEAPNRASYRVAKAIGKVTDCIYEVMQEQGMSQADLARRLGRSRTWVSRLLSGDHNMTIRTAVSVLHELGHNLDFSIDDYTNYKFKGPCISIKEIDVYGEQEDYRKAA